MSWLNALLCPDDPTPFRDVDIIVTLRALPKCRKDCPRLKYCHFLTAGFNYVAESSIFPDPSIRWTSSRGIHGPAIAEWVFMAYIAFQREYDYHRQAQREREWTGLSFRAMGHHRSLLSQRIGILGYGSVGRQIARVAAAFGMQVIACTATSKESSNARQQTGYRIAGIGDPSGTIPCEWYHGLDKASLHHFLAQRLDLLVICLPLTQQTRHLIGKEEFQVLRDHSPGGSAFIANVARGDVIVQRDLVDALNLGNEGVRGAALDVQSPEPLPAESELWTANNCFISPHNAGMDDGYLKRGLEIMLMNLQKSDSEPWINEVDSSQKY